MRRIGSLVALLAWPVAGSDEGAEFPQEKPNAARIDTVTLQYRVARDAIAPSSFVAVIDGGITLPLELIWDLPEPEGRDEREALERRKTEFDRLIEELEVEQINGVEFACEGQWITEGIRLRITTVPEPTDAGRRRIRSSRRQSGSIAGTNRLLPPLDAVIREVSSAEEAGEAITLSVQALDRDEPCVLAVTLREDARIFRSVSRRDGEVEEGSVADLKVGTFLQLWTEPWVGEECPDRATANVLLVVTPTDTRARSVPPRPAP